MPSSHNELQYSRVSCPIISFDTLIRLSAITLSSAVIMRRENTMDLPRPRWLDYDVVVIMLLLLVMALVELFVFIA